MFMFMAIVVKNFYILLYPIKIYEVYICFNLATKRGEIMVCPLGLCHAPATIFVPLIINIMAPLH